MTSLRILRAGPACTIQDAGRHGLLRYGVTPAGPMDWIGHATANRLAGNPAGAAAIEIGPAGIELAAGAAPLALGICAPGFAVSRADTRLPGLVAITLSPGERLMLRPGPDHVWAYLAVAGGFSLAPVMGSLSTHLRSGIGPFGGGHWLRATVCPAPGPPPRVCRRRPCRTRPRWPVPCASSPVRSATPSPRPPSPPSAMRASISRRAAIGWGIA